MIRKHVMRSRLPLWTVGLLLLASPMRGGEPVSREPETGRPASTAPKSPTGAWLDQVREDLWQSEYDIRRGPAHYRPELGEVYQASNRAHDLRLYFDESGVEMLDRSAEGAPTLLRLELVRWGRVGALAAAPSGLLMADANRLELQREGLLEWYVNDDLGLEQGWVVSRSPQGQGELVLDLCVPGAQLTALAAGVGIRSPATGRVLRYDHLMAVDAAGVQLPTRLGVEGDFIRLAVDDSSARYPVTLDPVLANEADGQRLESNQAGAGMGGSVSGAGDVNGDGYDDVIVGAARYDLGETDEGAAFIFLGGPSGITGSDPSTAHAIFQSNQEDAHLGASVSGAGDVNGDGYDDVIVLASAYDTGQAVRGAVFVFLGGPSGITSTDPSTAQAQLGDLVRSVSSAGDVNGDGYDDVLVGAPYYDEGETDEGAAFIFLGGPSGITGTNLGTAHAILQSNQEYAYLGTSVSGAGDVNGDGYDDVSVGAPYYDAGEIDEGAAFIFLGGPSGISGTEPSNAHVQLESDQVDAALGHSVSSAGDVNGDGYDDVLVGAPAYDVGQLNQGAAFIFLGSSAGITGSDPSTAQAQLQPGGASVSSAGDVNGDGYDDILVGASGYDTAGGGGAGAAFVYLGGPSGIAGTSPSSAHVQFSSSQGGMGGAIATAGDVNADGHDDVIVGLPSYNAGETDEGAAFVFPFPVVAAAALTIEDSAGNDNGVLEPDEIAGIQPGWRASTAVTGVSGTGLAASNDYSLLDATATYGDVTPNTTASCSTSADCYELVPDGTRPQTRVSGHWDVTLQETLSTSSGSRTRDWLLHIGASFNDVPDTSPFYPYVETLLHHSVTVGCSSTEYCPASPTTRAEMAVFVLRAKMGPLYRPSACTPIWQAPPYPPRYLFIDVSDQFCPWIEELYYAGVVVGCGGEYYCPNAPVTRGQMAIFVLKTLEPAFTPPACGTPIFGDVPADSPFCPWIEELARRGVVVGCGGGNYCPDAPVTREQMAVFLSKTFDLQLYGP